MFGNRIASTDPPPFRTSSNPCLKRSEHDRRPVPKPIIVVGTRVPPCPRHILECDHISVIRLHMTPPIHVNGTHPHVEVPLPLIQADNQGDPAVRKAHTHPFFQRSVCVSLDVDNFTIIDHIISCNNKVVLLEDADHISNGGKRKQQTTRLDHSQIL